MKNNETNNQMTARKLRSPRANVALGFKLFADNFGRIFRSTWTMALVVAVMAAAAVLAGHFTGNDTATKPIAAWSVQLLTAMIGLAACVMGVRKIARMLAASHSTTSTQDTPAHPHTHRHWSIQIGTLLITAFITLLLAVVMFLPFAVTSMAEWQSHLGVVAGDASGMPPTFALLHAGAAFIGSFLFWWVLAWATLTLVRHT